MRKKVVNETFWVEQDVILIPRPVLACNNCGERYYSRQAMRQLEAIEERLQARAAKLETVGQVLKLADQSSPVLSAREPSPDYGASPSEASGAKPHNAQE